MKFSIRHLHQAIRLAVMLIAVSISHAYGSAKSIDAERIYDVSGIAHSRIESPDGISYEKIAWPSMSLNDIEGEAELPLEYIRFMVPTYSNNFRVSLTSFDNAETLQLSAKLQPVQSPFKSDESSTIHFVHPGPEYKSVEAPAAKFVGDGFVDGCNHIVTVAVCPATYDSANNRISVFRNVTVRLEYDLCGESGLTGSVPIFRSAPSDWFDLDNLVVNPSDTKFFSPRKASGKAATRDSYYIIVPGGLAPYVNDLSLWKKQKGYDVHVKVVEEILNDSRYAVNPAKGIVDRAASLREYLKDQYAEKGAFFCLLVGNSKTSMPIRKACTKYIHQNRLENGKYAVPTDAYFSDLTQIWDLKKEYTGNEYMALDDQLQYNPDIFVGRLLCSTAGEVMSYTKKLIIYESNPGLGNSDYLEKGLFLQAYDMIPCSDATIPAMAAIFGSNLVKMIDTGEDNRYPKGPDVIRQMKDCGFSSWNAHGNPYGIACSDNTKGNYHARVVTSLDIVCCPESGAGTNRPIIQGWWFFDETGNGLDNLNNPYSPGIVYSMSCDTNPFDIFSDGSNLYDTAPNLGESYTCGFNYGGVAFLGNTRSGYKWTSDDLQKIFLELIPAIRKIGVCEAISKQQKGDKYLSCAHNLIGDPELDMWLGKPLALTLSDDLEINVPTPLVSDSKASVVIWDGVDSPVSYTHYNDGEASWRENPMTRKDFMISVWKSKYLPEIQYHGVSGTIAGHDKRFIVRTAVLGISKNGVSADSMFAIGDKGSLNISASDEIRATSRFQVENGGSADLFCLKGVDLTGSSVKSGGKLKITAKNVVLDAGFQVEAGATCDISVN